MEFLDLIQDEIIRTETTDTRWLLNSFQRGHSENVWSISNGGLTLEVGTNVNYATYANDGHMQNSRFVPGYWKGDRFVYETIFQHRNDAIHHVCLRFALLG